MVGNYTDYFAESQGRSREKVEKSFGGGRPRGAPAPVRPTQKRRLAIATNQGFGISDTRYMNKDKSLHYPCIYKEKESIDRTYEPDFSMRNYIQPLKSRFISQTVVETR